MNHSVRSRFITCIWGVLIPFALFSASGDSTAQHYIIKYRDQFYLKGIISQKLFTVSFEDTQKDLPIMEFSPQLGNFLGIGAYIFDLGFEISFRTPSSGQNKELYGKSRGIDWQGHILSRTFGIDVGYLNYAGFYMKNPEQFYPKWRSGDPYPNRSDFRVKALNFGFSYVFKPRDYSLPAVFNHSEQQIRSSGSFLLTSSVNVSELAADSGFIPTTDTNQFSGNTELRNISVTTISVAPGYSHNFIIRKKFYIAVSLALGPGIQSRKYVSYESGEDRRVAVTSKWRLGLGYNSRKFFAGLSFYLNQNNALFENIRVSSESGFVKLVVGYRFRERGILKHSIFELLPFLESKY